MKTLVVAPVTATGDLEVPEDAAAKLEAAIEERLGQAGFDIVPVFEYIGTWQHIADGYGGFYDSFTGDRNDVAFAAATDSLRSELRNRFDADGLFIPELWDGMAPFEWGVAKWDGATQEVFGAFPLSGEVRALSLVVHIEDLSGRELFTNAFGFATIEAWHNFDWLPLDLDGVIGDSRLIATAVSGALEPIVSLRPADTTRAR